MAIESQADQRRGVVLKDQHGRTYSASVENKTGVPTGLVMPMFNLPDPRLSPPQVYFRFDPKGDPGRFRIDYPAWVAEAEEATNAWQRRYHETVAQIPGGANAPMLPYIMGPRPMNPKPIRAMQQGNKWALGLSKVKPPEAAEFFPDPIYAPETPVFSGDVFSQQEEQRAERQKDTGQVIAERMAELEQTCPPELKGFAKTRWMLDRLKGEPVAQEA